MRILTSDYRWIQIKDVRVGESLYALDEEALSVNVNGRKTDRKIRIAIVEAKVYFKKQAFEVCLSNGVKLEVTGDHRMLFRQRGGCLSFWRDIDTAIVGDYIRSFSCPPQDYEPTYEDGWFAGLLDGEGSFGCYPAARIALSQVEGAVLQRAKKYLEERGIRYYEIVDKRTKCGSYSKMGDKPVHCIRIDRQADIIKILTMTRPSRFVTRPEFVGKALPNSCDGFESWARIESIRSIGEIEVVDLQTSAKTFICEGLVSHNSTFVQARYFHKTITNRGIKTFILTHEGGATKNLFEMTKRYYEYLPLGLCPKANRDSQKELKFETIDSGYAIGTAGAKGTGRSQTVQLLHGSEVAHWPNAAEHAQGLFQAVGDQANTEIILESTANGIGNFFHQSWVSAEQGTSDFQAIFVPWYWQPEYKAFYTQTKDEIYLSEEEQTLLSAYESNGMTREHIYWRRFKIGQFSSDHDVGVKLFNQEYPCIVGSQRVGTQYGIIPIKDVLNYQCVGTNTGAVVRSWCSGEKDTIELQTSLGYTLQCTLDHRIKTENEFVEANNTLDKSIILSIPRFASFNHTVNYKPMACIESSIRINEQWGTFLGFFMGDGSFSGECLSFAFNVADVRSIQTITFLIKELFGLDAYQRTTSTNGIEVRVSCKALKLIFLELGIIELTSVTKRKVCVPDGIWRNTKSVIKNFLCGLFDADGFAAHSIPKISFFSKHEQFVKDVQLLLLGFGITSKRTKAQKIGGTDKHTYTGNELTLRGDESRLYAKEIGFISQRKIDRMSEWNVRKGSGRKAQPIIFADKVISINPKGSQLVYDLEIDNDNHVFDAQGILVHNCCANDAFLNPVDDTFINSSHVIRARKSHVDISPSTPLIIGVDPAIGDNDRCAIIKRKGRVAYDIESLRNYNTMELAGKLKGMIERERPAKVFIDCIGIGAGVVDRLQEMGFECVEGVNVARTANDKERFGNLRAELWSEMRDWLMGELPVQIPDQDELHADLCSLGYKHRSNGQMLIESKLDLKARGMPSCDLADSLMLTFAMGQHAGSTQYTPNFMPKQHGSMFT